MSVKHKDKILTFDTNFIIENQNNFQDIINKLSSDYDVYVPQLSINERIAQQTRDIEDRYEQIHKISKENKDIIKKIEYKQTEKSYIATRSDKISEIYISQFGENFIIPFDVNDVSLYKKVLERAMKKLPPFSRDKNASDKGFKDCLLWFTLIEFFKDKQINAKVLFITKDNGFINNSQYLSDEFKKETKLDIEIKPNLPITKSEEQQSEEQKEEPKVLIPAPNIDDVRTRLREYLSEFCNCDITDDYGNYEYTEKSFKINDKINKEQAEFLVRSFKTILRENILSTSLLPSLIFGENFTILDQHEISIETIVNIDKLHDELINSQSDLVQPFYNEVANQINNNFYKFNYDDLPF